MENTHDVSVNASLLMSPQVDQVFAAVIKAQEAFKAIPKGATNPFFHSKYADLPAVIEAAQPVLTQNNLGVIHLPTVVDGGDGLATMLVHQTGQYIGTVQKLHLPKNDPQSHGSAITYARRYGFMAVLNLVADLDDDGNAASRASRDNVTEFPSNTAGRKALRALCEERDWDPEMIAKLFQGRMQKSPKTATNEDLYAFVNMVTEGLVKVDGPEPQPA